MRTFRSAEERQETGEQSRRAMRGGGFNGDGDLKLVNLLLSARETSDRFWLALSLQRSGEPPVPSNLRVWSRELRG
jgi:hypothetical protein